MTKRKAKGLVCHVVASFMDAKVGHDNGFVYENSGGYRSLEDTVRMEAALQDLVDELYKRGEAE